MGSVRIVCRLGFPKVLPKELELKNSYRGAGLPWSRLLLDIHTGRIFGSWEPYMIDGAAFSLLMLIGTGIYNWSGRGR